MAEEEVPVTAAAVHRAAEEILEAAAAVDATDVKFEGAGIATWLRPDGTSVQINRAYSNKLRKELLARGWTPLPKYMP